MSLARALTTRRKASAPTNNAYLGRAASQRAPNAKPIKREEISLPVELLSTTNVLSYEAPNIPNAPHVRDRGGRYFSPSTLSSALSVSSSHNSDNDSDNTASDHSHETDATSIDLSSPETTQDHFSHFGSKPFSKSAGTVRSVRSTASSQASYGPSPLDTTMASPDIAPAIPVRSPSRATQKARAHVLAHQRSVMARSSTQTTSTESPLSERHNSLDMFNAAAINNVATEAPTAPASHPFGKELEQLNEAAEEFGHAVRNAEADADLAAMESRGLVRFCATEYMDEIAGFSSSSNPFADDLASLPAMAWI